MASGHFYDDKPGSEAKLREALSDDQSIMEFVKEQHQLDHEHDIPYIGGISEDGATVYIDKHLPLVLAGMPIDKWIATHEKIEFALIRSMVQKLGNFGPANKGPWQDRAHKFYEPAHHLATAAEAILVREAGFQWPQYIKALRPYYKPIDHEALENPPKDLALYPYTGKLFQFLWDSRKKITKVEAGYRPGNLNQHCGICTMFQQGKSARCSLVLGNIQSGALCNHYEAKH